MAWFWNKILSIEITILTSVIGMEEGVIPEPLPALKLCKSVAYDLLLRHGLCKEKHVLTWCNDPNLYLTIAGSWYCHCTGVIK